MKPGYTGGKRQREAERDRKKQEKEQRLRRNRELSARGLRPDVIEAGAEPLPEVKLEDIVIGVPKRPKQARVGPTRIFVGGLSWNTTTDGLRTAFSQFGAIAEATVIQDSDTGRSRGFGFITFENSEDAETAIKKMSGAELDGRTLKVNRADPR